MKAMTDSKSEFDLDFLCRAWDRQSYDSSAALIRWNQEAARFGAMKQPTLQSSLCLKMLQQEGLLEGGGRGLDVGCGGGQYSLALEKFGFSMHGTDFSPNMIGEAEKNNEACASHCTFSVDDWHSLDLREKGWEKAFDLVMAHMTPAILNADCFLRLIGASRKAVFLQKPTRRSSELQTEINKLLNIHADRSHLDDSFAQAFSIAWLKGFSPKTGYEEAVWEAEMSIPEAVRFYSSRLKDYYSLQPGDPEKIETYLREKFPDGTVKDVTHTHLAALLFRVDQEDIR